MSLVPRLMRYFIFSRIFLKDYLKAQATDQAIDREIRMDFKSY